MYSLKTWIRIKNIIHTLDVSTLSLNCVKIVIINNNDKNNHQSGGKFKKSEILLSLNLG